MTALGYAHDPFLWLNQALADPALDGLFLALTTLGDGWITLPLVALVLALAEGPAVRQRVLVAYALGAAATGLALGALKLGVAAPRPLSFYAEAIAAGRVAVHVVGEPLYRLSFPSGHTETAFYAATFVLGRYGRRAAPALVLAALVGLSRVYVGAHFVVDVLAGAALGTLGGALTLGALARRGAGDPPGRAAPADAQRDVVSVDRACDDRADA
jgi:undecaprenyl-diphosphatase